MDQEEDFELWLMEMDDALQSFLTSVPMSLRSKLQYDRPSLDALEAWVLAEFQRPEQLLEPAHAFIFDGLARYVGESFRLLLGGKWQLGKVALKVPELTGPELSDTPLVPHSLLGAALDRRTGTYLTATLSGYERMRLRRRSQ